MSRPKSLPQKSKAAASRGSRIAFIAVAAVAAAALTIVFLQTKQPAPSATTPQPTSAPPSVATTALAATNLAPTNRPADAAANPKFAMFVGRWQRTDGDYAIDIQSVAANGEMKAGYFNPRPIKVSRAEAFEKDGKAQMYLELRDENYPGSYYALTINPATGMLGGIYFQATMRETFEVEFVRLR